jgi:hypothetical protein
MHPTTKKKKTTDINEEKEKDRYLLPPSSGAPVVSETDGILHNKFFYFFIFEDLLLRTQTLLSWARPWLVRVFQTRRTLPCPATLLEGAETAVSLFAH